MHERSVDGDFLLLELKGLLRTHPKLKVILMSATINHDVFIKYFDNAPLLTIPGFAHPVEDRPVPHLSLTSVQASDSFSAGISRTSFLSLNTAQQTR